MSLGSDLNDEKPVFTQSELDKARENDWIKANHGQPSCR